MDDGGGAGSRSSSSSGGDVIMLSSWSWTSRTTPATDDPPPLLPLQSSPTTPRHAAADHRELPPPPYGGDDLITVVTRRPGAASSSVRVQGIRVGVTRVTRVTFGFDFDGAAVPGPAACLPETTVVEGDGIMGECCAVCLEEYEAGDALRTLPCAHGFHERCIFRWLSVRRLCPLCRRRLTEEAAVDVDEEVLI